MRELGRLYVWSIATGPRDRSVDCLASLVSGRGLVKHVWDR